jgi:mannose-6-phosphate isomerase-like protein (cupin superfamily)
LEEGDLVLVPMAAWHQYFNSGNMRCKVMALQTPHPIMHTLIDETNGAFGPRYPEREDAAVSTEA